MAETNQLQAILKDQEVDSDGSSLLLKAFGAPFEEAGQILADYQTIKVEDEYDKETMKLAREKRLALKKVRTTVENKRKELKADIVKQGRAIDSVARFVKEVIAPAEEYLQLQEDFVEIKARERAAKRLAIRTEALAPFVADTSVYDLGSLTDDQFTLLMDTEKANHAARIEAERVAEAERESERKRQAQIEEENAKLRAQAEAERKRAQELEAAERERLDAERRAKEEAERKAKEEAEASDPVKLQRFAEAIRMIRTEKLPTMTTTRGQATIDTVASTLESIEKVIHDNVHQIIKEADQ